MGSCLIALSDLVPAQHAAPRSVPPGAIVSPPDPGWSVTPCLPQVFCGTESGIQEAFSIDPTPDGGAIVAATPYNSIDSGPRYLWIARHTAEGRMSWERKIAPTSVTLVRGASVSHDDTGILVVCPHSLVKLDRDGALAWSRKTGFFTGGTEYLARVSGAADGGFVGWTRVVGAPLERAANVARVDKNGDLLWQVQVGQGASGVPDDHLTDLRSTSDGGVLVLTSNRAERSARPRGRRARRRPVGTTARRVGRRR